MTRAADQRATRRRTPADGAPGTDPAAAERLRRRYPPPRVPRAAQAGLVALAAAVGSGWLVWAGLHHARPAVTGQVASFQVVSDTRIDVVVTVQRRDVDRPVQCRVVAQAADFQPVAEQQVAVPAGGAALGDVTVSLVTLRRATSASVSGCSLG